MSKLLPLALAATISFVAIAPAAAFQNAQTTPTTAAAPAAKGYDDHLVESGSYVNSDGQTVHRPAHTESGRPPEGATAQCRDNTYSFSQHHQGTCSHHGGVARWL
ncbi:DUF3761 domain-containing protein [Rhodanobacter sp. DHB23]|uniref:DUF3761 domain-containing protein n=1 Tax=Rhodanobacter sp. DHB23 TaxID=2775923 RepID=UPI001784F820|nr:DUF3761 domain-containing protein [Rhodanobacter sp. DHB23]MBD8873840.1 DUF3761 domain-containing protein [Rhodanobacter sp. DHB23]